MKIGDIYRLCKEKYFIIEKMEVLINDLPYNTLCLPDDISFSKELIEIECLKDAYEKFIQLYSDLILTHVDISSEKYDNFKEAKLRLLAMMECIINMYEGLGIPSQERTGLDVKFPLNGNFSDFRKNIDELDFVLTKCPFFQNDNETLQFSNVDIGSLWLTFTVVGALIGGSILLNNIAAFVDKCIIIRSHYLTTEKQKAELEKAQIEQKEKEEMIKSLERFYKIAIDNAIFELEEITKYKLKDGEERARTEQAFDKLGKLLDQGMQLYASLDSPEENKVLFKPLEMHYLGISENLKLLEDKEE